MGLLFYAFNTKAKAVAHLKPFNQPGTRWVARLNVGKGVGHSSINLYANGKYAGTLQGNILGSALYREPNGNGIDLRAIPLTWNRVLQGVDEVYAHPTSWGTWFCHDITAAVFRRWGLRPQDVYETVHGYTPLGRPGLVLARIAALIGVPGTTAILGGHEAWNKFQEAWQEYDKLPEALKWPNYLRWSTLR
ncbi:hypothetical protein [Hymenobacter terrenus]|uniref:hypothetical protein n=1 Tax=Hymenobacter terrenus TaxID=1629124 RepID=UPI000619D97A|nr:hypothetical protein [Hymenobacter terrenus]